MNYEEFTTGITTVYCCEKCDAEINQLNISYNYVVIESVRCEYLATSCNVCGHGWNEQTTKDRVEVYQKKQNLHPTLSKPERRKLNLFKIFLSICICIYFFTIGYFFNH